MSTDPYGSLAAYRDRTVLVTGGGGFVGSALTRRLIELGARVTVLDDWFTGEQENLAAVLGSPHLTVLTGDVRDSALVSGLAVEFEYVFHLAARNIIISTKDPREDFSVNIGGTLNMLLAARQSKRLKKFVYASSVSVYGNPRYLPINEDDRTNLLSPYSVSKLGGENYTIVFYENYDLPVTVVRYSNVYGEHQTSRNPYCGVAGKFVECISRNEPPVIHGDGHQTRDFTYVGDAVEATLLAGMTEKSTGDTFNVGSGVETSVNVLVKTILDIYGKTIKPEYIDRRDIDNIRRRVLNIEKIRYRLKWSPRHDLRAGLERTIAWFEGANKPRRETAP